MHFMNVRKDLSKSEIETKSKRIIDTVTDTDLFNRASVIHCFYGIQKNREVQTDAFIRTCMELGKTVVLPRMVGESELRHHRIDSLQQLEESRWGIREPSVNRPVVEPSALDLIMVPMVAGDRLCNRLGYGKGYYDRFLAKTSAPTIGVLFDCTLSDEPLPVEPFDIPLGKLITESAVYQRT